LCGVVITQIALNKMTLTFGILKRFRDIMKNDVVFVENNFHRNVIWPYGSNASFIAMILKCENPQYLDDYRPICLVGCVYKRR